MEIEADVHWNNKLHGFTNKRNHLCFIAAAHVTHKY